MTRRPNTGCRGAATRRASGGTTIGKSHGASARESDGQRVRIAVEPRMTLVDALRERLALTGTKRACDRGECGACTVHIDGRRVAICFMTGPARPSSPHQASAPQIAHVVRLCQRGGAFHRRP
jgi:hypothetical protein